MKAISSQPSKEPPEMIAVWSRSERLETENRKLKGAGVACLLVVACVVVMAQVPSNGTVEAQRFNLKDSTGKIRASLSIVD